MKFYNVLIFFILNLIFIGESSANSFYSTYPELIKKGQLVSKDDYKKIKIKSYFSDGEIYYYKDDDSYYELKVLPDGVIMMRDPETDIANFGQADSSNFSNDFWQSLCTKDEITDAITCMVSNKTMTILHTYGRQMISPVQDINNLDLSKKHFTRIDTNPAISANGVVENPKYGQIIAQMKSGKVIKTRYFDIKGTQHDNSSSLGGFKYAYEYAKKMKEELKKSY